jgi:hypothetical protein
MKENAPEYRTRTRPDGTEISYRNLEYNIVMHAHRNDNLNAPMGSTSKMREQTLIRHDRHALEDNRPWNQVAYGQICLHYRKSSEHPSLPGKEKNASLIPGLLPGPQGEIWAHPQKYPVGHPLEDEAPAQQSNQGGAAGKQAKKAPKLRYYNPSQPIPVPSQAAVKSIRQAVSTMKKQGAGQFIRKFDTYYAAWRKTWFEGGGRFSAK